VGAESPAADKPPVVNSIHLCYTYLASTWFQWNFPELYEWVFIARLFIADRSVPSYINLPIGQTCRSKVNPGRILAITNRTCRCKDNLFVSIPQLWHFNVL